MDRFTRRAIWALLGIAFLGFCLFVLLHREMTQGLLNYRWVAKSGEVLDLREYGSATIQERGRSGALYDWNVSGDQICFRAIGEDGPPGDPSCYRFEIRAGRTELHLTPSLFGQEATDFTR